MFARAWLYEFRGGDASSHTFLAGKGYSVLGVQLAGHGTHLGDMIRSQYTDWLHSIQDGFFELQGVSDKIILIRQSLGAILVLVSTPEITPTATIAISTPFLRYSTLRRIRNRLIPVLFPLVPKNHLKHRKISDIRRESHYPAYPLVAMSSTLELEKVQQTLKENLGKIQSPVLLIQSHKDLSEESIAQITSKLVRTKYESIWHDNFNHSMVLDKNRKLVFEEIDHYIQKITNERGPR